MRIKIVFDNPDGCTLPFNHQEYLTAVVYRLLEMSCADYSRFLHDEGYDLDEGAKRFKLFTISGLRSRHRINGTRELQFGPGCIEWYISSPIETFCTHCATGLLKMGEIQVGQQRFRIQNVQTLATPDFSTGQIRCGCLTPIVAAVRRPHDDRGDTQYLRPSDGEMFSEAIRKNLQRKTQVLTGTCQDHEPLVVEFDPAYLAAHRGGTKMITYKGINIIGVLAPFIATGAPILLRTGYECGFGEKNAAGFGMVEVKHHLRLS